MPAVSAILNNFSLLHALIACLSSTNTTGVSESSSSADTGGGGHGVAGASRIIGGRKRAGSLDGSTEATPSSKNLKMSQSPSLASSKRLLAPQPQLSPKPQLPLKQTVATILMVALEHIDHWPAPLVKAYGDDCFGPRNWVDDDICKVLVDNLKLLHEKDDNDDSSEDVEMIDEEVESASRQIADYFAFKQEQYLFRQGASGNNDDGNTERSTPPPTSRQHQKMKQRGSMSSVNSQSSANHYPQSSSAPLRGRSDSVNSTTSVSSVARSSVPLNAEDSDSGDEEEEIESINQCALNRTASVDDGDSSSSGEEDEEIVVSSTRSFEGEVPPPPSSPPGSVRSGLSDDFKSRSYPVVKKSKNFDRVRQRFFGQNRTCACDALVTSLTERLEVKSKQNSGLLQALQSFTSIPEVRSLITKNLEKWLQSPALSGLARALFSKTVSHMKNTNPPIPADLETISHIMSMRLKANQVCLSWTYIGLHLLQISPLTFILMFFVDVFLHS